MNTNNFSQYRSKLKVVYHAWGKRDHGKENMGISRGTLQQLMWGRHSRDIELRTERVLKKANEHLDSKGLIIPHVINHDSKDAHIKDILHGLAKGTENRQYLIENTQISEEAIYYWSFYRDHTFSWRGVAMDYIRYLCEAVNNSMYIISALGVSSIAFREWQKGRSLPYFKQGKNIILMMEKYQKDGVLISEEEYEKAKEQRKERKVNKRKEKEGISKILTMKW